MRNANLTRIVALLVLVGVVAGAAAVGADQSFDQAEIMVIEPVTARTCLAVKVVVAEDQLVTGLLWYNNDEATVFPYVLAAAGFDGVPPSSADTLVLLESVSGAEDGWSELQFGQGITCETGVFYVIFQFPPFAETTGRGAGPGIGYAAADSGSCVFFSAEGEDWVRLITSQRVLVEPVYGETGAKTTVLVLPSPKGPPPAEAVETEAAEEVVVARTELGMPYPNPFNPMSRIPFALKDSGPVVVSIHDVRGHLVRRFDLGLVPTGLHEVVWLGRDDDGRQQPSGVYFARMESAGIDQIRRLVLVR